MTKAASDLAAIRQRIDRLDEEIQARFTERARLALQVAQSKRAQGETSNFYRPEREAEVLDRAKERNEGPLPDAAVVRLFREIMSACLALQEPLRIAFLGPRGTFTQEAAIQHFGHAMVTAPLDSIAEVFREVEAGAAQYGVVPLENSTEGSVNYTLDMLMRSPLRICGEVELRVHQNLLSKASAFADIHTVFGHQQSLAQCREWVDANLAHARRVPVSSNAEGARRAVDEPGTAALASEITAEIYGLAILSSRVEDEPDNATRFAVIGRQEIVATGDDRTSLLLSARDRPGALFDLLEPFAEYAVSMTRLESRPSHQGAWDYVFFVDIEGHPDDAGVRRALDEVRARASLFRILGAYPRTRT